MAKSTATTASEAARRYARALFELASEKKALAVIDADLKAFEALVQESVDLKRLLASPAFAREDKVKALTALADKAGFNLITKNFLGTVAQNGRTTDLLGVITCFDELYAAARGVKRAIARTAKDMTSPQRSKLEAVLAKAVGSDVELQTEVNPDLVGGIQLLIGSTLIDASIAAKLERMNIAMKGA